MINKDELNHYSFLFPDSKFFNRLNSYQFYEFLNNREIVSSVHILKNFKHKFKNSNKTRIQGAFFKCRKLGLITEYDQDMHEHCNFQCLMTLFFSLFIPKMLTNSLIEGKYINKKYEVPCFLIGTVFSIIAGISFCYIKKAKLDRLLDEKYSQIYQVASTRIAA
jgi:hypothetical protein